MAASAPPRIDQVVQAREDVWIGQEFVQRGRTFRADDPLVVAHRRFFEPFQPTTSTPELARR